MRAEGEAEPFLGVVEAAGDGQGGGGEDGGAQLREEPLGQDRGDVDGCGLQEAAAPAPLDPVDVGFVAVLDQEAQAVGELTETLAERHQLLGRVPYQFQGARSAGSSAPVRSV